MGRFSDALRQGLDAQAKLEKAQQEVREVLQEASAELAESTEREFRVKLVSRNEFVEGLQTKINDMMGILPSKTKREFFAIDASVTDKPSVMLAEIEFEDSGYSVTLKWPERYAVAADKDAFVSALEQLLKSRHAGERISSLLK